MNKWHRWLDKKTEEHEADRRKSRSEHRKIWSQILVLCSAILGFSAALVGGEKIEAQNIFLIISWIFLALCIIWGVILLLKDSKDYLRQSFKSFMFTKDIVRLTTSILPKQTRDNQLTALSVLHSPEDIFNKKAKKLFEQNKRLLDSWCLIKDPERFYFGTKGWLVNVYNKIFSERSFLILFVFGLIMLTISIAIVRI